MRIESVPFVQAYSCRSSSAKGVVRSVMAESVGEGVDEGLQLVDSTRQIIGCIELVPSGRLGALDAAVEVGPLGWQHKELQPPSLAFSLEDRFELAAAIDLNAADGERRFNQELVEQRFAAGCARLCADAADGPFGDRVIGGEVLDRLVGPDVDEECVDLDEFARGLGLAPLGQAASVTLLGGEADALGRGPAAQEGHGDNGAALNEMSEIAADGRDRDDEALAAQQHGDLTLAPHRIIVAQVFGGRQFSRPLPPTRGMRAIPNKYENIFSFNCNRFQIVVRTKNVGAIDLT
jgi:hypothetical protein